MSEVMEVNGTKYVLKDEYDKLKKEKTSKHDAIKVFMDEANTTGMGVMPAKDAQIVRISSELLFNALESLKKFYGKKDFEIDFAIKGDYPLMIGKHHKDEGIVTGIIIAPKIRED